MACSVGMFVTAYFERGSDGATKHIIYTFGHTRLYSILDLKAMRVSSSGC